MSDTNHKNPCSEKICQSKAPESKTLSSDVNAELRNRPILYTGVIWIGVLRRFLIPRSCGSSLPPVEPSSASTSVSNQTVAKSLSHINTGNTSVPTDHKLIQNQPTAIYPNKQQEEENCELKPQLKNNDNHSPLAALVTQFQEASATVTDQVQRLSYDLHGLVDDGKKTTSETIANIRKDNAVMYRYAAITVSGLVGYLAGVRRGTVTRLVYSMTGTSAVATICYPEEARRYNTEGLAFIRQYVMFGLSLMPDGPQKGLDIKDPQGRQGPNSNCIKGTVNDQKREFQKSQQEKQSPNDSVPSPKQNFGTLDGNRQQINPKVNKTTHADSQQEFNKYKNNMSPPKQFQGPKENLSTSSPKHTIKTQIVPPFKTQLPHKHSSPSTNETPILPLGEPPNTAHGAYENLSTMSSNGDRRLSQYEGDFQRSLSPDKTPYSPVSPIPPKENSNFNEHSIKMSTNTPNQTHLEETTVIGQDPESSLYHHDLNDSLDAPETSEKPFDDNTNTQLGLFSIPEPFIMLEDEQESSKCDDVIEDEHYPLNKKLSRYYINKHKEKIDSTNEGYEDLYSKRN